MAEQAFEHVERIVAGEVDYESISEGALDWCRTDHGLAKRDERLNRLYTELASGPC